jgi:hypothetical protein
MNPRFQQAEASDSKKRRMSSDHGNQEDSTLSNANSVADQYGDQSSKSARKRSRKTKTEEPAAPGDTATASPVSCSAFETQNSMQSWTTVEDTKSALATTLHKHHGTSKKKNPPPGGFKPWNTSPASDHLPSGSECINPITGEVSLPNLENLTKEEIRKVKNRASAQRSRTRKTEQTYELRLENAKLMERIEALKKSLKDVRPDLCVSLALDKPEPSLLSSDNSLAMRCEGTFHEDEEKQHMQMLIHGLRSQLDSERNQRVAAERKISYLEREIEMLAFASSTTPSISTASKLTLDQVAERENAIRIVYPANDLPHVDMDDDVLCSVTSSPVLHKPTSVTVSACAARPSKSERFAASVVAPQIKSETEQPTTIVKTLTSSEQAGALMFVSTSS